MQKFEFHMEVAPKVMADPVSVLSKLGLKCYHLANYGVDGQMVKREYQAGGRRSFHDHEEAKQFLGNLAALVENYPLNILRTKIEIPYHPSGAREYAEAHIKFRLPTDLTPAERVALCMELSYENLFVSERLSPTNDQMPNSTTLIATWRSQEGVLPTKAALTQKVINVLPEASILDIEQETCVWDSAVWRDARWMA